jgi:uncharacterized membrane protein YdbT with pleckstrin-like domain
MIFSVQGRQPQVSYVESNLIPGEQVLYQTGLHWIVFVGPVIFAAIFGLAGLPLLFTQNTAAVGLLFLVFAGFLVLLGYLSQKATEMAVTNKRILIKTGLVKRRTLELLLSKVESIGVEEGLLGRLLGYGSVVVHGIGGTPEPFKNVAHPLEFRRQVQQRVEEREQR